VGQSPVVLEFPKVAKGDIAGMSEVNPSDTANTAQRLFKVLEKERLVTQWGAAPVLLTTTSRNAFSDFRIATMASVVDESAFAHEKNTGSEWGDPWQQQDYLGADESTYMWGSTTLDAFPKLQTNLGSPPRAFQALFKSRPKMNCKYEGVSIGHNGSGLVWHHHSNAFNLVAYGRKRWWLSNKFPPGGINPIMPVKIWARDVWPTVSEVNQTDVLQCTTGPGDILYVPDGWFHQTLNLGQTVALTLGCGDEYNDAALNGMPAVLPSITRDVHYKRFDEALAGSERQRRSVLAKSSKAFPDDAVIYGL
jgi:ribosomal protein L16 Arg81 hydroxylase